MTSVSSVATFCSATQTLSAVSRPPRRWCRCADHRRWAATLWGGEGVMRKTSEVSEDLGSLGRIGTRGEAELRSYAVPSGAWDRGETGIDFTPLPGLFQGLHPDICRF